MVADDAIVVNHRLPELIAERLAPDGADNIHFTAQRQILIRRAVTDGGVYLAHRILNGNALRARLLNVLIGTSQHR